MGSEIDAVPLRLATLLTVVLVAVSLRGGERMAAPQQRDEVAGPDPAQVAVAQHEADEERRRAFCETLDGTPDCSDFVQKEIRWLYQTMEEQFCGGECPEAMPIFDIKDQRTPVQKLVAMEELAHRLQDEKIEADIRSRCPSNETVITLRRTPGFTSAGFAISYELDVCGDGTVVYRGEGCFQRVGVQKAKVDSAAVRRLVQAFLSVDYFGMQDYRNDRISDSSIVHTSLTLGQRHKSIVDYGFGPEELRNLEDMIDEVAGSNRWLNIDAAGVKEKVRQGWDLRSPEAGLQLLKAAAAGDIDTVRAFIEKGADVNAKVDLEAWESCRPPRRVTNHRLFVTPIQRARGVGVVRLLIDAGANVNPKAALDPPLRFQIGLGDADSVKALIEAGAGTEAESPTNGATALMDAVNKPNGPNPAVVEALLRAGANVNAKDNSGRTALDMVPRYSLDNVTFSAEDEAERMRLLASFQRGQIAAGEVERMLISAGAVSGSPVN